MTAAAARLHAQPDSKDSRQQVVITTMRPDGKQNSELDHAAISENDRLVNDARVFGDPKRKTKRYKCDICGHVKRAKTPPECDNCHVIMHAIMPRLQ